MKKMKRLVALALSVVMVLAMSVMAFADDTATTTYTITINNETEGHTYEAYQIFTGDLLVKEHEEKVLSNINWGNGITDSGKDYFGDAATKAKNLSEENIAQFAKDVSNYLEFKPEGTSRYNEQAKKYTISGLSAGYYLVREQESTSVTDKDDFYSAYIMEVVGNVTANPKGNKPTLDKQIKHNERDTWGVVGDNQIGDTVEFRTITTVPDTTGYTTYSYIIYDTMSEGLTSNVKDSTGVVIKVNDENGSGTVLDQGYYNVVPDTENPNKFSITVNILSAIADNKIKTGDKLYSYYTGILNEKAKIYNEGKQDNTAYLEYSNNPNNTKDKGKTPEKKVYDWTFKMGVKKIAAGDETKTPLTGAKFVLSKNPDLGDLTETTYQAQENNLISLIYNEENKTYTVAPSNVPEGTSKTQVIEAGEVTIKGLDDATDYYLYEIKAPEGYNKLTAPTKFKITAEDKTDGDSIYNNTGDTIKENNVTVKIDTEDPSTTLVVEIINNAGSNLPSTGGIGTTIFYIIGGILMVGAAILLITKRRAEN